MTIEEGRVHYFTTAETAKLVRQALKTAFPSIRFSVRSKTYSGGASIDVDWIDGPRRKDVEATAKQYEGGGFDGMIDLKYSRTHYLRPDGATMVLYDPGTVGSMGVHEGEDNRALASAMPDGVQAVRFGADFIFCSRSVSRFDEKKAGAMAWVYAHCHTIGGTGNPNVDQFGNDPVERIARKMASDYLEGEGWQETFARLYS